MMTATYSKVDRTGWPEGPWDDEPDRFEWYDADTDLPCLAKRNGVGAWCGYVAVPPGHRMHGIDYGDIVFGDSGNYPEFDVHGGLTYSGECSGEICHVPRPGEADDVHWFGFDCAHSSDTVPARQMDGLDVITTFIDTFTESRLPQGQTQYRSLDYVKGQCAVLAQQLAGAA